MVKFKSLAQFPVDHLSHPLLPTLVFFHATLQNSLVVWKKFFSLIILYISNYLFDINDLYNIILCCYQKIFSFSLEVFSS